MIKFSERLKELRLEKGFSQSQLADKISVGQKCISNWEKGHREPDFEMLAQLAEYFNVTVGYLLGVEE